MTASQAPTQLCANDDDGGSLSATISIEPDFAEDAKIHPRHLGFPLMLEVSATH